MLRAPCPQRCAVFFTTRKEARRCGEQSLERSSKFQTPMKGVVRVRGGGKGGGGAGYGGGSCGGREISRGDRTSSETTCVTVRGLCLTSTGRPYCAAATRSLALALRSLGLRMAKARSRYLSLHLHQPVNFIDRILSYFIVDVLTPMILALRSQDNEVSLPSVSERLFLFASAESEKFCTGSAEGKRLSHYHE